MPLKPCIKNLYQTYMHYKGKEERCKDINGKVYYRYYLYDCDCGSEHKLDVYTNVWVY